MTYYSIFSYQKRTEQKFCQPGLCLKSSFMLLAYAKCLAQLDQAQLFHLLIKEACKSFSESDFYYYIF